MRHRSVPGSYSLAEIKKIFIYISQASENLRCKFNRCKIGAEPSLVMSFLYLIHQTQILMKIKTICLSCQW